MEEDQEMKHFCKFCDKSFPCGRSLGGHMRSHLINMNSISHDNSSSKFVKKKKKKVSSVVSNGGGYTLRENRKKTTKFASSIDDDDHHHHNSSKKICKECGKGFQSWKALFGHMKCHSDKVSNNNNNNNCSSRIGYDDHDHHDSWNSCDSDDEESAPIRKQRSRTIKRYNNQNNSSSSACDDQIIEQEEQDEEVAMSLILLSRHHVVGCWDSQKSSVSASAAAVVESSENNNSEFLESRSWSQTTPKFSDSELKKKMKKKEQQQPKINNVKLELDSVSHDSETLKMKQQSDDPFLESSKNNLSIQKNKRKGIDFHDENDSDEVKKIKFECTSCNKTFHSYQALGGHRASHKKMKACCFGSKIDSSENSTETADSKFIIKSHSSTIDDGIEILASAEIMKKKKKNKGNNNHECPICFKVFLSGQALGGHKRSHLIAAQAAKNKNSSNNTQVMMIQKKVPEIRDFLDLNLPPEDDQEQETSDGVYFNPWWMMMGSNNCSHKNEQQHLVGLL